MKDVSIGILGAGTIVRQLHLPVLRSSPGVRVAWVADASANRANEIGDMYGVNAVALHSPEDLPQAECVLVAIPVGVRQAYYELLARRGTALLAEKPFAVSAEQHRRYTALFPASRIGCAYMRRFYGSNVALRDAIRSGCFGPMERIRISEGGRTTRTGLDRSPYDDRTLSGGGVLMSLGCHAVDQALFVTGATRFEILTSRVIIDGPIDRKVETRLRLFGGPLPPTGCELDLCVSWLDEQDNTCEVSFAAGATLRSKLGPSTSLNLRLAAADGTPRNIEMSARGAATWNQAFYLEWEEFLAGVDRGSESRVSARSAQLTADLIDAIYDAGGYPIG